MEPLLTLRDEFELREGRARNGTTTFYDTFDGRLYADGVTLRHTDGRYILVDRETGDELVSAAATAAKRLFTADLPGALRGRLADVIEMHALTPMARVRARRQPVAVLNDDGETAVRLLVECSRHRDARARLRRRARAPCSRRGALEPRRHLARDGVSARGA